MKQTDRGLLAGLSECDLKKRISDEPYAEVWKRLCDRAAVAQERTATEEHFGYGSLGWLCITPMVMEAGLVARLTGNARMLEYVSHCIGLVAEIWKRIDKAKGLPGRKPPVWSHGQVALAADLCRDILETEIRETFEALARDRLIDFHAFDHSLTGYGCGANIPLCQNINAGIVALAWGPDCGHPEWESIVDNARDACIQYLRYGCDHDGYSYEGTGYGHGVFRMLYFFAQLLHQNGRDNLFESRPVLERIADASLTLIFPDRSTLVNINDLGLANPHSIPWLLLTSRHYNRPDHLGYWYEFQGPNHPVRPYGDLGGMDGNATLLQTFLHWDADAPHTPIEKLKLPTANCSLGTGTANFRTSWRKDAVYVNVLGAGRSHTSWGHVHADCGHFSIFAHGEYLAVDTGRYNVNEDQHNVVLVDGRNHMEIPEGTWGANKRWGRLHGFQRHDFLDYVAADAAHTKNCIWADRHVLFVRLGADECYMVTIDNINKDNAIHSYWWQMHVHPGCQIDLTGDRQAEIHGAQARLDITFAFPCERDFPDEPHRLKLRTDEKWWAWPYGKDQDLSKFNKNDIMITSLCRPRLIAEETGMNCMIAAIVVPRKKDQSPLLVQQISENRVLRISVESERFTDTILSALDHGYIKLKDLEGFTELAVIRRHKKTGRIETWTVDRTPIEIQRICPRNTQNYAK